MARLARALTIAGSDSGGGAGIQADLKTFTALGVYGASAVTAVTAQNTLGVQGVHVVPVPFVAEQIDSVMEDIGADAAKTGMLATPELIEVVAKKVEQYRLQRLVVDPVMVAKGGDPLIELDARQALARVLIPLAEVVTPNPFEAQILLGRPVRTLEEMKEAARAIVDFMGARCAVVKGGSILPDAADVVYDGKAYTILTGEQVQTPHTHGTGCTFSAAIAAGLARGMERVEAIRRAKRFTAAAIKAAPGIGKGRGPVNHQISVTELT